MIKVGLYKGNEYEQDSLLTVPYNNSNLPCVIYEDSRDDAYYMSDKFRLSFKSEGNNIILEKGNIVPREDIIPLPEDLVATVSIQRTTERPFGAGTKLMDKDVALDVDKNGYYFLTSVAMKEFTD